MFENLRHYKRIYVTGPQRSGTTICSQMIAKDTGYVCIDEIDYKFTNRQNFAALQSKQGIVVQCPIHCYHIEDCSDDETLIVMMIRPINEIIQSQERIDWQFESEELGRYNKEDGPISKVKYDHWNSQKRKIKHYREIHYHSLRRHPLWQDNRKYFDCKQTHHYIAICDNQPSYNDIRRAYCNSHNYQYHYERNPPDKLKTLLETKINWVVYLRTNAIFNPRAQIEKLLDDKYDIIILDQSAIIFRVCDWCIKLLNAVSVEEIPKIESDHIKKLNNLKQLFARTTAPKTISSPHRQVPLL